MKRIKAIQGKLSSYEIIETIGQGNFGKVYKVQDLKSKEIKALKRIDKDAMKEEPKLKELIHSEINIMSDLIKLNSKNKNIVKYYEDFEDNEHIYIVIEYCENRDLKKYMKENLKVNKLTENHVLKIFKDILNGFKGSSLKYNFRIFFIDLIKIRAIHRDFKPENIFVHKGVYKIGDFGFGKKADLADTILGTSYYMALEIFVADENKKYNNKVDVWALAICTYEMLFGFCPFIGKTDSEVQASINKYDLTFCAKDVIISDNCKDLIQKMLIINPQKRISWEEIFVHPWVFDRNAGNILKSNDIVLQSSLGFFEDLDIHHENYLQERNMISHFMYVLTKGFLFFPEIQYNFGFYAFAKYVLIIFKEFTDNLMGNKNLFNIPELKFEEYKSTDNHETLKKIIEQDYNGFKEFYSLYYMQLEELNVYNDNYLFLELKKLCSPDENFDLYLYRKILIRYLKKTKKIFKKDEECKICLMFLDAIDWSRLKRRPTNYSEYRNKIEKEKITPFEITKNAEALIEKIEKKLF